jgi:hypothetical protein
MPVLLAHLASNGRDRHAIPERVLPPTQRLDLTEGIHENKEKKDNHECTSRQDSAWVGGRVITFHTPLVSLLMGTRCPDLLERE